MIANKQRERHTRFLHDMLLFPIYPSMSRKRLAYWPRIGAVLGNDPLPNHNCISQKSFTVFQPLLLQAWIMFQENLRHKCFHRFRFDGTLIVTFVGSVLWKSHEENWEIRCDIYVDDSVNGCSKTQKREEARWPLKLQSFLSSVLVSSGERSQDEQT